LKGDRSLVGAQSTTLKKIDETHPKLVAVSIPPVDRDPTDVQPIATTELDYPAVPMCTLLDRKCAIQLPAAF
jgi:hypothetical protein